MPDNQPSSAPPETPALLPQDGRRSTEKESMRASSRGEIPLVLAQETKNENNRLDANTRVEGPLEDGEYQSSSWRLGLITIGLALAIFCLALDNTIISTAIPKITDEFKSLEDVGWYGSAYLLTTCALCLMFGKLYTFYSTKWVYLTALLIFELGSLVCGVTSNSLGLIIGRAIAGLGAAGLFSGALIIIAQTVPLNRRPVFAAMMGSMYGVSSVAGPLMGGAFTDHLSWRWCFYINLPCGGATALFILFFFQAPKSVKDKTGLKNQVRQLDIPGTILFMPSIICVLLALQWGGTMYAWSNARIIALFVVFGILLIAFLGVQWWQQDKATIPPWLIKNRNVWGAASYAFCLGGSFFIFIYYLPIWFQAIKGVSATRSGIMNFPLLLPMIVASIAAGACVTMIGYYTPFMIATPILISIGGGLLSTLKVDSGDTAWIGYQVLYGIGVGIGMQQPMMVVQTALPLSYVPTATALVMFCQTLGGTLFVSVAQNVFQNQLRRNILAKAPGVDIVKVVGAGATMLRQAVSKDMLPAVLEAYNDAVTQTFYAALAIGAIALAAALPIQWLSVKGKKIAVAAAA
ncbi:major facilitator superfamily domain-containing protein [Aspergillus coremiiformis]|uniref:Major facilitator superfamily domain-containing protein n=1 Tax=Aspergillus coremiiformis TaxID=138285 RepID=A0A5N6YZT8_9EURO|nr:major facilitator superfamily domain-containing protein [Aspergillus coremiiformis]